MSDSPADSLPTAAAPPLAVLTAWLDQSHDLLASTTAEGQITWRNAAFSTTFGAAVDDLLALAPTDWQDGAPRAALLQALTDGAADLPALCLCAPSGRALWVRLRVARRGMQWLWTAQDITASHEAEARARHLSELLDMAQEFGRLGVWEREVPSGRGRWDRHVFKFFGMDPTEGTPDFELASKRMHPDDRRNQIFLESLRQAGRYSRRYRVVHTDGSLRWIHSQWEVKTSAQGVAERTIGIMMDDTEAYELARSLDAATAHLRLAAELGNLIIWRHDLKTGLFIINDRGRRILDLPDGPVEITLDMMRAITHSDDVADVVASAQRALTTDEPVDVIARYRGAEGGWRSLMARRVVERGPDGEPLAFVGVSLDVTEQAQQAREAQQLAKRLEAAARAGGMGIWSTILDTDEAEWNDQMFELFNRFRGGPPPNLQDWLTDCVHPEDAPRVGLALRSYIRDKVGALEIEFRTRAAGDRIRWIVLRADFDHTAPDRTRMYGIAMDVTDQHRMLTELNAAAERSALIAQHAGIGTWQTDERGSGTQWDEQMFRLRGMAPRQTALDREERLALVHPDDVDRMPDSAGPNASRAPAAYEFRVRWPDGSVHWLASRSAPVHDAHGQFVGRMGVNWDVTESKNAELARQQAQLAERESQAKSRFLSRMSHELRTPLNAVLGFTQLLQADARAASATDRLTRLNHIRAGGEHLLALINDALDLSDLESGTLKIELRPVATQPAVARACEVLEALATSHSVRLRQGALPGVLLADPARLHQVLLNLLSNAIKNSAAGGEVIVAASDEGAQSLLRVSDAGRRLRPDQLANLFEPFNRLGIEGEGSAGSGIGLTIARAIVHSMGGEIGASSHPGQGTLFELSLPTASPVVGAPVWSALAPIPNAAPSLPARQGCLLYIEDNEVNVLLVEELVKSIPGLQFVAAANGEGGVAAAVRVQPDVILIDLQLPDFDGFEVLRRLRAQPDTARITCIALSANAMPEDIERGRGAGFDDYWTKPIRFKPFLEALERLFQLDEAGH